MSLRRLLRSVQRAEARRALEVNRAAGHATLTRWNGDPAPAECVRVRVGTAPAATWWCAGLEGTVREAVQVTYGGQVFYLDNEDGSGWAKVTRGGGGPAWPHRSLPGDSTVVS